VHVAAPQHCCTSLHITRGEPTASGYVNAKAANKEGRN
ncbi:unnamed protein product, partial [Ectocarpus sp. 6 AP-2014]